MRIEKTKFRKTNEEKRIRSVNRYGEITYEEVNINNKRNEVD